MKKMNFLGYEVNIIDDEDVDRAAQEDQVHLYAVARVADTDPSGGSPQLRARRVTVLCEDCGQRCYLDPMSYRQVAKLRTITVCLRCLARRNEVDVP